MTIKRKKTFTKRQCKPLSLKGAHTTRERRLFRDLLGRLGEATRMVLRAMVNHRLRTLLTMLGIIIGIASVVSVVALGEGSRQVLIDISAMGTPTLSSVNAGKGFGDQRAEAVRTLHSGDAGAHCGHHR